MKMKWWHSLPAKLTGLALAVILMMACLMSGGAMLMMLNQGYYESGGDYYETEGPMRVTGEYASDLYLLLLRTMERDGISPHTTMPFQEGNFGYEVQIPGVAFRVSNLRDGWSYRSMGEREYEEMTITCYVRDPITAQDRYQDSYWLFETLYPQRNRLVWVLAGSGVLLLVDLCYLLAAAGRRRGVEGVTPNRQDRIPLDGYFVMMIFLLVFLLYITSGVFIVLENVGDVLITYLVAGLAMTGAACVMGLAILMTLATRCKLGKPWRNTMLYHAMRLIWDVVVMLVRALPLIWKVMVGFACVTLIELALLYQGFAYSWPAPLLLYALVHLAVFAGVGLVALGMQSLKTAGEHMAAGDLDHRPDTRWLFLDLKEHAENLGRIGEGMSAAVAQRMRSERLKTELITNVSHDIKTPLTSIINYVDLLGKQGLTGEAGEYVTVLERQAARLKKLTDDLVEASKASTGNLAVKAERTDLCELATQTLGEYAQRLEEGHLEPVLTVPEGEVPVLADGRHLWRVMDNLLSNVCRYAQAHTRVYVDVAALEQGGGAVTVRNISRERLKVDAQELMERFVQGDSARATEGSGLGLHIARSLMELQGGTLTLTVDGDLFKAELRLPPYRGMRVEVMEPEEELDQTEQELDQMENEMDRMMVEMKAE